MKTVLFIPGFQEDLTTRDYASTIRAIEARGYKVIFVPINWSRTTIRHWVEELNRTYETYDPKDTILAGFSFGAMTAFMAATQRSPSELWLFSLSPYFQEDIHNENFKKSWLNTIGHRRANTFKELAFSRLVKEIDAKILFFYGSEELKTWTDIEYRHQAVKTLANARTCIIDGVGHDVTAKKYIHSVVAKI